MKKIAVLSSGGDSPGMNAGIRAVVRTAVYHGLEAAGIRRGYEGMIDGDLITMDAYSVANIIQRGGTILGTARSKRFLEPKFRQQAFEQLQKHGVEGLVLIGGDGTFTGAKIFYEEFGLPSVGIPGTIDNDLYGTDFTIGFDTAINTVVEAVDKIRDTAEAHNRLFFIEVMGRDAGYIALQAGIGSGAEEVLIPETPTDAEAIIERLRNGFRRQKKFGIVIVAEGDEGGGAYVIAEKVKGALPELDIRISVLGHIQRGGNPSCRDRLLASRLGYAAVLALMEGKKSVMIGERNGELSFTDFGNSVKQNKGMNTDLLSMARILGS